MSLDLERLRRWAQWGGGVVVPCEMLTAIVAEVDHVRTAKAEALAPIRAMLVRWNREHEEELDARSMKWELTALLEDER